MVENQTLSDYMTHHCTQSMEKAIGAERFPQWKRHCPELTDIDSLSVLA